MLREICCAEDHTVEGPARYCQRFLPYLAKEGCAAFGSAREPS